MIFFAIQTPKNFPKEQFDFNIAKNSSLNTVTNSLIKQNLIKSPFIFKLSVILLSKNKGLFAGDYRFTESENLLKIAFRMANGIQGLPKIKVTIPEGTNVYDMAYIYMIKLTNFNAPKFVALAQKDEGYLFPDTYYFLSNTKPEAIIKEMKANFNKKILGIKDKIDKFGKNIKDIIIMASIIEEEALGLEDKRMVSGVLWNRLSKNMLLQVDPPFYYITGKTSGVTFDDLKIDSPYNTYKYKGLPKGPISNPGLESIIAAIDPIYTKYYFYLTGNDGVMRYATNYDGHMNNKNIYLR